MGVRFCGTTDKFWYLSGFLSGFYSGKKERSVSIHYETCESKEKQIKNIFIWLPLSFLLSFLQDDSIVKSMSIFDHAMWKYSCIKFVKNDDWLAKGTLFEPERDHPKRPSKDRVASWTKFWTLRWTKFRYSDVSLTVGFLIQDIFIKTCFIDLSILVLLLSCTINFMF